MKLVTYLFYACTLLFFISCSHSNHVTSSSFIQKRKYNKGFHFSLIKRSNSTDTQIASIDPANQKNNDELAAQKVELSDNSIQITESSKEMMLLPLESIESKNSILIEPNSPIRVALSKLNQPIQTVSQSLQKLREPNIVKNQNDQKSKSKLWLIGLIAIGFGLALFLIGVSLWTGGLAEILGIGGLIIAGSGLYLLIIGLIVRCVQIKRSKRQ